MKYDYYYYKKLVTLFMLQKNSWGGDQKNKSCFLFSKRLSLVAFFILFFNVVCHAQGTITGFNLINSSTDQVIQPLTTGAILNLAALPTRRVNIQAVTNPSTVGSVVFNLSGQESKTRIDNHGPNYSLQGDNNGDY